MFFPPGSARDSCAQFGVLAELLPLATGVIGEAPMTAREGACAPRKNRIGIDA